MLINMQLLYVLDFTKGLMGAAADIVLVSGLAFYPVPYLWYLWYYDLKSDCKLFPRYCKIEYSRSVKM